MASRPFPALLAALTVGVIALGCTAIGKALANQPVPGYGVSPELAAEMGCDLEDIKRRGDQYKKQSFDSGGPGYVVPSVGDTGCDVLAKLGRPDDFDTITTELGGSMNWWYNTGSTQTRDFKAHLVTLRLNESGAGIVVTSVVW